MSKKSKVRNVLEPERPSEGMSSDLKQESGLALSEAHFGKWIAGVEDYAMVLLDPDGVIQSWNRGASRIKGYSAEEACGKNYRIFYTKEDKDQGLPEKLLQKAAAEGKSVHEGWRIRKDGTRFWAILSLTTLYDEKNAILGFLKITRDLTERKLAEDNFSNYAEELRQRNEELARTEDLYHKMISEVKDYAIILLDKDGKILEWNKGAERLKGYSSAEILGKTFRLFYTREDKDAGLPDRLLREAVNNGHASHEGWRIRKDGTRFWGSVSITALHDDAGQIIGFSKVTRDLTPRKIAEERMANIAEELTQKNEILRRSEERYHKMISEVQDYAIILLDRNGDIQNWNAGAQYIKGYVAEEILGKHFSIFYEESDRKTKLPQRLLNEAITNGKATHEGWRVRKDGSRFWGSIVITALHDTDKNIIGFSKVTRDLTERKEAEEALRSSAAQMELKNKTLERLNAEISSFVYIASHDLKEPLRKIQTFADRLPAIENLSDKGKDYLERIRAAAERMQRLMEDLLAYSQVTSDQTRFEDVDMNEILAGVKNDLEIAITEKNAIIVADSLPVVHGISFQLHQMLLNLLSNSLKFSKTGVRPLIKISHQLLHGPQIPVFLSRGETAFHRFTINDNGIGFEPDYSKRIFDVFHRLHSKATFSGTGIGLAIVKKVVENHNGIITADGQPDIGATFQVFLPAKND